MDSTNGSNLDLMNVLVAARQEQLRRSGKPIQKSHEANRLRKSAGVMLIRLGQRMAGGQSAAPEPAPSGRLALP